MMGLFLQWRMLPLPLLFWGKKRLQNEGKAAGQANTRLPFLPQGLDPPLGTVFILRESLYLADVVAKTCDQD